jgi:hypothetical protein
VRDPNTRPAAAHHAAVVVWAPDRERSSSLRASARPRATARSALEPRRLRAHRRTRPRAGTGIGGSPRRRQRRPWRKRARQCASRLRRAEHDVPVAL